MTDRLDRRSFATLAGASLLSAPFVSRASAQTLTPLKVGYDGFSMTTSPMNYGFQKGIFRKHGIELSMVYIDAGVTLTQAVVGGSVDLGQNGYTPAAAAAVQGVFNATGTWADADALQVVRYLCPEHAEELRARVRKIRTAISPRLATRTLRKSGASTVTPSIVSHQ